MKACVPETAIEAEIGVTAIETKVAADTVSVAVLLVTADMVAVIALVPDPTPVATPLELIVATPLLAEFHVARDVMLAVELSL